MRRYVKRGCVSSRQAYNELKWKVWEEVHTLDLNREVFHGHDIQEIAMHKAREMGLHDFKVITVIFYIYSRVQKSLFEIFNINIFKYFDKKKFHKKCWCL